MEPENKEAEGAGGRTPLSDLIDAARAVARERARNAFPLELIPAVERSPEDFRLLARIPYTRFGIGKKRIPLDDPAGDEKTLVIIDTETTGVDPRKHKIIELALVKVRYSPGLGRVTSIEQVYDELEDPGEKLHPDIVAITGLTDADLAGHRIDDGEVCSILAGAPLMVAHNAAFDRPMFEKRFAGVGSLDRLPWACSCREINWNRLDGRVSSYRLPLIASAVGYFYDAHRAAVDCLALLWLLSVVQGALAELLANADRTSYVIRALGAPYEVKDLLRERSYRWYDNSTRDARSGAWWNFRNKYWFKTVYSAEEYREEVAYLNGLYGAGITAANQSLYSAAFTALERFK